MSDVISSAKVYNVLPLFTDNSARAVVAEATMNKLGEGGSRALSPAVRSHRARQCGRRDVRPLDRLFADCAPGGEGQREAFIQPLGYLQNEISRVLARPLAKLDDSETCHNLRGIVQSEGASAKAGEA